jgi:hypothetical protein
MHIRIVLASLCIALPMLASGAKPVRFDAQLQSFNAAGVPVNSNAVGQAWVEIVDDGTAIYYQVEVAGIENAFMAHIHVSGVPVQLTDPAGPIVFWFFGGPPASPANAIGARINGSLARGYINADANIALTADSSAGTPAIGALAAMPGARPVPSVPPTGTVLSPENQSSSRLTGFSCPAVNVRGFPSL